MARIGPGESILSVGLGVLFLVDDGIRFKLDEPIRIDKPRHLHNRVRGTNLSKELAVDCGDCFPIFDAHQQRAGANDVLE